MKNIMRIKLWESFNRDEDAEMVFIDLLDADLKVSFGEYDSDTIYVDIISPPKLNPRTMHEFVGTNLDPNLIKEPILNWIELTTNNSNHNWWLETKQKNHSGLSKNKNSNVTWNNEYLDEIASSNNQLRIVIKKNMEHIESYFNNLKKDFYINLDNTRNIIYITKKINYRQEIYNNKYKRCIAGEFTENNGKINYLRNTKTYRGVNIEKEVESYKKIFYALQADLVNLNKDCYFEVNGKDFIEINLNKRVWDDD